MELPSAFRTLLGAHRLLIAICVLLPLIAVGLLAVRATPTYTASARIQANDATLGSDTEADSVLNLVRGIATSSNVVQRALRDAGITGHNPEYVATHDVTLTRLGSSPAIDVGVIDRNAGTAVRLAGSLAGEVVNFLRVDSQQAQIRTMDQFRAQENALAQQRAQLTNQLNAATDPDEVRTLSTELSNVEQQYTQTAGALQQLEVTMAAGSTAAVIGRPGVATRVSSSTVLRLVLAGFGGLVLGLLLAAVREMLTPRVADARAAARELDAPLLGAVTNESLDTLTALAVQRAAERAEVTTLAVAGRRDSHAAAALTEHFVLRSMSTTTNGASGRTTNGTARKLGPSGSGSVAAPAITKLRLDIASPSLGGHLRAVALSEIAAPDLSDTIGLLVAVSPRMTLAALTRVRDVASATGWPIVGVLDAAK